MKDLEVNDEFKSDKYSVSINELMFSRRYRPNIAAVSTLLDDNGYFGRYRIESIKDKKFPSDTLIIIHVYLCDSLYTYSWPLNTFFNLNKKLFGHNRKIPRGVFNNAFMFSNCVMFLSTMFTPRSMFKDISLYDANCINCLRIIEEGDYGVESWAFIISNYIKASGQRPFYEKILPYLCRIGLISNNKFIIVGKEDPQEICDNLFDINYWSNL
jgi:hypothetical protein